MITEAEAIRLLKDAYENAPTGEKATQVHLFGIKYADGLKGLQLGKIARQATGTDTYGREIYKGIKLAKYVKIAHSKN